ncbi:hypothetical protein BDW69DRAFT_184953 [Aspergillus filifer]
MPKLDFYSTFHYHALVSPIKFSAKDDTNAQKSIEAINMIALIASDLRNRGLKNFYLSAGRVIYRDPGLWHEPWTLFAYFGNSEKGMDLQTRTNARDAVLSVVRASQPSHEKPIQDLLYMPNALHERFHARFVGRETRFQVVGGRAFVHTRDGQYDVAERGRCEDLQISRDLGTWGHLSRPLSRLFAGGNREKEKEKKKKGWTRTTGGNNASTTRSLTFEEALAKLQTPWGLSEEEKTKVAQLETIIEALQETEREERQKQEAEKQARELMREEVTHRTVIRGLAIKSLAISKELTSAEGSDEHKEEIRKKYMDCTNKMMMEIEVMEDRQWREYA